MTAEVWLPPVGDVHLRIWLADVAFDYTGGRGGGMAVTGSQRADAEEFGGRATYGCGGSSACSIASGQPPWRASQISPILLAS